MSDNTFSTKLHAPQISNIQDSVHMNKYNINLFMNTINGLKYFRKSVIQNEYKFIIKIH